MTDWETRLIEKWGSDITFWMDALLVTVEEEDNIVIHDDGRVYATVTIDEFAQAVQSARDILAKAPSPSQIIDQTA
jgi:hypothetical protein